MSRIPVVAGAPQTVSATAQDQKVIFGQVGTVLYSNTDGSGSLTAGQSVTVENNTTLSVASGRGYVTVVDVAGGPDSISEASLPTSVVNRSEGPVNVLEETDITGDGTTDDTDAIQAAFTAYAGERSVRFPRGQYVVTERVTIPSQLEVMCDPGAVFVIDDADAASGTAMFYGTGTDGTKTALDASTSARAESVVLPTGQGANFSVGDVIGFESDDEVTGTSVAIRAREIRRVVGISTDTVTLDAPLHYAYTTGDNAVFWKITPIQDVVFAGAVFEMGDNVTPGTDKSYCIRLGKALNCRIDARIENGCGGVYFSDAIDCRTDRLVVNGLPSFSDSYGYCLVLVGSCHNFEANGLTGRNCRHVFTTLFEERSGPLYYGGPQHVSVNQARGYGCAASFSIFDTHQGGRYIEFNECVAVGGGTTGDGMGFQIRSDDVTLNNCRAISCKGGVRVTVDASRCTINGGEFSYSKTATTGIGTAGADTRIQGAHIHHNASNGVTATASTATDLVVQNCRIHDNVNYGVQLASTTPRSVVQGCFIPFSTGVQTVAVLNAAATAVITGNVATGYTTVNQFFGATAGAKIHDNVSDGSLTVTAAATLALPSGNPVQQTTGATTIDNITTAGWEGRTVTLRIGTAVTISHNASGTGNLRLSGAANFSAGVDDTLTLACIGSIWYETARTVI